MMCFKDGIPGPNKTDDPCAITPTIPKLLAVSPDELKSNLVHSFSVFASLSGNCWGFSGSLELIDELGNSWKTIKPIINNDDVVHVIQDGWFNS